MAVLDFLLGRDNLREQRNRAQDFARERYDPSQFSPQVNLARERATEGISEGQESQARRRTVESLFRPTDTSIYGGNQARAIAGQQQQNRQAQQGMADFESQLTQQDLQAQQQGQQQFAQARTQQRQTAAQRDAAIEQADMQYEAELESRRRQLGSTVANLAGTVAGSFLGPAGAAAGGAIAGGLAGGGMGAVQGAGAGFSTAFQRQQSQQTIDQLTGGGEQQQQGQANVGDQLANMARSAVDTGQGAQQSLGMDLPNVQGGVDMGQPMEVPQSQPQAQQLSPDDIPTQRPQTQGFNVDQFPMGETGQFIDQLVSGAQQQQQDELSFEEFQRMRQQEAFDTVSGATAFGGYSGGQGAAEGFMDTIGGIGSGLDYLRRLVGFETPREQYQRFQQNQ